MEAELGLKKPWRLVSYAPCSVVVTFCHVANLSVEAARGEEPKHSSSMGNEHEHAHKPRAQGIRSESVSLNWLFRNIEVTEVKMKGVIVHIRRLLEHYYNL